MSKRTNRKTDLPQLSLADTTFVYSSTKDGLEAYRSEVPETDDASLKVTSAVGKPATPTRAVPSQGWLDGLKKTIAKKFKEDRARSHSMPATFTSEEDQSQPEEAEEAAEGWHEVEAFDQAPNISGDIFYDNFDAVRQLWNQMDTEYLCGNFREFGIDLRNMSMVVAVVLLSMFVLPLPSFLKGFLAAVLVWWMRRYFLEVPVGTVDFEARQSDEINSKLLMPPSQEIFLQEDGWINLMRIDTEYDAKEHSYSRSSTAHLVLEKYLLRIRFPKDELPKKAMWTEKHKDTGVATWTEKRFFVNLKHATLRLLPENLSTNSKWNRRYPIEIKSMASTQEEAQTILLFARTNRDKEHWYSLMKKVQIEANKPNVNKKVDTGKVPVNFLTFMMNLGVYAQNGEALVDNNNEKSKKSNQPSCPRMELNYRHTDTQWVNLFAGRILYDFFTKPKWTNMVKEKLQRQLSKVSTPYLDELKITEMDLGERVPMIRRTSNSVQCPKTGTWLDLEVAYQGLFTITVITKVNFSGLADAPKDQELQEMIGINSPESSEDEFCELDENAVPQGEEALRGRGLFDKISSLSALHPKKNKFVRSQLEYFHNLDLKVVIKLKSLFGRLALNIPPPPSDRLWYGFRSLPRIHITAIPHVGEPDQMISKLTSAAPIGKFLERRFMLALEEKIVMPNMDDIKLGILDGMFE